MTERANHELLALYVRLYFDEDVSVGVVENLRQRGFDVQCARDVNRLHLDDDAQLAFAVAERRAQPRWAGRRWADAAPANFMMVAAMNPCPCGFWGDPTRECTAALRW